MDKKPWTWSSADDAHLADLVLTYIRNGKTQLQAFEDIGEILGRTSAACGFRWNSKVRHQFVDHVKDAKMHRNIIKHEKTASVNNRIVSSLNMKVVLEFLKQLKQEYSELESNVKQLRLDLDSKKQELAELRIQNKELSMKRSFDRINDEDYQALLKIIERAIKLSLDQNYRFSIDLQNEMDVAT